MTETRAEENGHAPPVSPPHAGRSPDAGLQLLVDQVRDYAIFTLDPQGRVATWNAGAQRLKGYREEEILGQPFERFYTEADRAEGKPERQLRQAREEGRVEDECWCVRKDGSRFWASVVITALRDSDGMLVGFGEVTRDLTGWRQEHERYRFLVDSVRDYALFTMDVEGRILSWNPGAQRVKGYRAEEIIGRNFECFYTPEDRAKGKPRWMREQAATHGRVEAEGWRVRKDGSRFWADAVLSAVRDESGALRGFAKVTRDVTERRRLGFLGEASAILGSSLDVSETLPAVARLSVPFLADWVAVLRFEHGEISPLALVHSDPESARRAEALGERFPLSARGRAIQSVVRTGRATLFTEPTDALAPEDLGEAARVLRLHAIMVVPLVVNGRLLGVMGFANAETDHRFTNEELAFVEELGARCARALENARVHEALRVEHELLETVVRQMPEAVIVFDESGALLVANGEAERILGPERVAGTRRGAPPALYRNGDLVPAEARPFARALRGEAVREENFELGPEDRARTISVSAVPVQIAAGRMAGAVVTFQDVTERRREEAERERQAYFRERFIGILGHDLRNPLSAILGSAHLLLRKGLPEAQARSLGRIASSADRMAKMISDVLDLTRVRMGGGIPVAPRRVDVHEVARGVVEELEIAHPERTLRFSSSGDTWAEVDPDRIAQVFSNLLSNAIQHGAAEDVSARLSGVEEEVWLEVHNAGEPIPPELMGNLFDPFRRELGPKRERSAHGLGLGLFIAKELVAAHGGRIEVESTREAGTTFRVGLPRVFPAGLPREVP